MSVAVIACVGGTRRHRHFRRKNISESAPSLQGGRLHVRAPFSASNLKDRQHLRRDLCK